MSSLSETLRRGRNRRRVWSCDVQKVFSRIHRRERTPQVSLMQRSYCRRFCGASYRQPYFHKKPSNAGTDGCTRLVQSRLVSSTRAGHLLRTDFTHDISRARSNIHKIPTRILYRQERCLTHHPPGCDSPRFLNKKKYLLNSNQTKKSSAPPFWSHPPAMIVPVRCFTCGKVIGNKWQTYTSMIQQGKTEEQALDELGLPRYCCRRMILTHVELSEKLLMYDSRTTAADTTPPRANA